jgi:tetratricopeptide (TPR) repeat protein
LQAGKTDVGIKSMEAAASQNTSSDLYFRQLSQVYLSKLETELQNVTNASSADEKNNIQQLMANAVNASKLATDINPKNIINWSVRGYIYQNLFGIANDAEEWALSSYDQALKLDPNNPYLFAQKGNVNYIAAIRIGPDQSEKKGQFLEDAKTNLEKSVSLNPNYSNALYSLGLVYDALGQKDKATQKFVLVQQLNPQDTNVPKILENLRAGRSALQTASPIPEAPSDNSLNATTPKNPSDNNTSEKK